MSFNSSTFIPGDTAPSVRLNCGNLRIAFFAFSLLCWIFTLVFICAMAAHSVNPKLAEKARNINDFFGNTDAFMTGPVLVLGTLLYFAYSRKKVMWFNGLVIDDILVPVTHYEFKTIIAGASLIYLRSAGHLWIIYPVTSQDNVKFKNARILKEETTYNQTQVELLKSKLIASGATEKHFWFLTKGLIISLVILTLIMILALSDT